MHAALQYMLPRHLLPCGIVPCLLPTGHELGHYFSIPSSPIVGANAFPGGRDAVSIFHCGLTACSGAVCGVHCSPSSGPPPSWHPPVHLWQPCEPCVPPSCPTPFTACFLRGSCAMVITGICNRLSLAAKRAACSTSLILLAVAIGRRSWWCSINQQLILCAARTQKWRRAE